MLQVYLLLFWMVLNFIYFNPSFIHPDVLQGFIKTIVTYGSIPALIACLIGEVLYRKIKRCREFQFGIPLFIGLAVIYTLIPFLFLFNFSFHISLTSLHLLLWVPWRFI